MSNQNVYKLNGNGKIEMYSIVGYQKDYDMITGEPYQVMELSKNSNTKENIFVAENIVKDTFMNFKEFKDYADEYVFVDRDECEDEE